VIHFEDLLAARVVYRQRPDLRGALAEGLQRLDASPDGAGFQTLLGLLVKEERVTQEQAEFVHDLVDRVKRGRELGIYVELLVEEAGAPRARLQALLSELGGDADCVRLGDRVVQAGLAELLEVDRLRFRARQLSDADRTRQLKEYRGRRQAESASTLVGGAPASPPGGDTDALLAVAEDTDVALGEARIPSGVYRTDKVVLPSEAEATGIIDRASVDLTPPVEVLAPRFPIPEWVDTSDPLVGKGVGGFRVLGRIGAGAMGAVYLADHTDRTTPVALKLLPPTASPEARARFKREILANSFFSHENAIDVYDAGQTPQGRYYLAMEFFDGADLERVLQTEGTVSLRQTLTIARQLLEALAVAHRAGIVHRDIKPANILVAPGGGEAKLMDFGIALIKDLGEFKEKVFESDAGGVTGTPEYLSPEQAFRDPVGPPSDLYSLGMVIYRMLAGRLPFESETVSGWISSHIMEPPLPLRQAAPSLQVPDGLVRLLDRLFVKKPAERIQTAAEVLQALDAAALEVGTQGRKSRLFDKFRRGF
jgi:hypothetical protein